MTPVSQNVCINKLNNIDDKYNTYHRARKMISIDVKSSLYFNVFLNSKEYHNREYF